MNTLSRAVAAHNAAAESAAISAAVFCASVPLARLFGPALCSANTNPFGICAQIAALQPPPAPSAATAAAVASVAAPAAVAACHKRERRALERLRVLVNNAQHSMASLSLFTYVELFAGVGGFSEAARKLGGRCVLSSELAHSTAKVWNLNFGPQLNDAPPVGRAQKQQQLLQHPFKSPMVIGDVRRIPDEAFAAVAAVDLLCAGFPCQPFSKLGGGAERGLEDEKSGDLYLQVVRALRLTRAKTFLLENVPGLDAKPDALAQVIASLQAIGYDVAIGIMQSARLVPQKRNRLYFVGFRRGDADDAAAVKDGDEVAAAGAAESEEASAGRRRKRAAPSSAIDAFAWPQLPLFAPLPRAFSEVLEPNAACTAGFALPAETWAAKQRITQECGRSEALWFFKLDEPTLTLTRGYRRGPGHEAGKRHLLCREYVSPAAAAAAAAATAISAPTDSLVQQQQQQSGGANDNDGEDDDDDELGEGAEDDVVAAENTPTGAAAAADSATGTKTKRLKGFYKYVESADPAQPPRYLTHREAIRLQGFPESFLLDQERSVSGNGTAQAGNAVTPPMIMVLVHSILSAACVPSLYRGGAAASPRSMRGALREMLVDAVPARSVAQLDARFAAAPMRDAVLYPRLFVKE